MQRTYFPDTDEEVEELRRRVREEHAAYMRKWAGWKPEPSSSQTPR